MEGHVTESKFMATLLCASILDTLRPGRPTRAQATGASFLCLACVPAYHYHACA